MSTSFRAGAARFFVFRDGSALLPDVVDDSAAFFGLSSCDEGLFGEPFFDVPDPAGAELFRAALLPPDFPDPPHWRALPLRSSLALAEDIISDAAGGPARMLRAYHVVQWRKNTAYCGRCGTPNGDSGEELARSCPSCGKVEYPRISPAVIVLVTDEEDRILLAHNSKFRSGMYSLVAGFTEAGEALERTVAREVKEEVGIDVDSVEYRSSQPWPFPDSIMIGFRAKASSKNQVIVPDGKEIEDARWFSRDALPDLPFKGSLSRLLIDGWLNKIGG